MIINSRESIRINWKQNPIDEQLYDDLSTKIATSTNYKLPNKPHDLLGRQIYNITLELMKDKVIRNIPRLNKNINKLTQEYNNGIGILQLSNKYDFPPIRLLYAVLSNNGTPKHVLNQMYNNKVDPESVLNKRDLKEYKIAIENDFNDNVDHAVSQRNEDLFVNLFHEIPHKTQLELTQEQIKEYGHAIATPDILFTTEVYINDVLIKWIDFKDYVGSYTKYLHKSNIEQSERYNKIWGFGAFCYSLSYVEGYTIKGATVLDGTTLNLKFE